MPIGRDAACSLVALGAATGAVILGSVLAPATGGGSLATVALAGVLGNVGAGLIGNVTHEGIRGGYSIIARLRNAARQGRLPENHDLARALRKSQLRALSFFVEEHQASARAAPADYDTAQIEGFTRAARRWLKRELQAAVDRFVADLRDAADDFASVVP